MLYCTADDLRVKTYFTEMAGQPLLGQYKAGADSIAVDWTVYNIEDSIEMKARSEPLVPFLDFVVRKAFQNPLPESIKVKLSNSKAFPLANNAEGSDCAKVGNGYFCFSGVKNDSKTRDVINRNG